MSKAPPKWLERTFELYPTFHLIEVATASYFMIHEIVWGLPLWLFVSYFQSPLLWRGALYLYGPCPKVSYIGRKESSGSLWQISYFLQAIYTSFSFFERVLKLVPGAYSSWLRMWGAKVGRKITWTPGSQIVDRPFVNFGDRVLAGQNSYFSTHVIKKKDKKYLLYLKDIEIGPDTVISYRSTLSAGTTVGERCFIPAGADIYPNTKIESGTVYEN